MDRVLARLGRTEKDSKSDGSFAFAISLFIACFTGLDKIHSYFENNQVSCHSYIFYLSVVFTFLFVTALLYIIVHIFFKAIALETNNFEIRKKLESIAINYYLDAFRFTVLLILLTMYLIILYVMYRVFYYVLTIYVVLFLVFGSLFAFLYILRFKPEVFKNWAIRLLEKLSSLSMSIFKRDFFKPLIKRLLKKSSELMNFILEKLSNLRKRKLTFLLLITLISLLSLLSLITILFCLIILCLILSTTDTGLFFVTIVIVVLFGKAFFYIISRKKFNSIELLDVFKNGDLVTMIAFIIIVIVLPNVLSGHLAATMNSIYYIQDKQIPLDISVTGVRDDSYGVFVDLHRTGSKVPLDSMNMQANSSVIEKFLGKNNSTYLCGNSLDKGKYKVFINCSNLPEGYYELLISYKDNTNEHPSEHFWYSGDYFHNNESIINSFYLIENKQP